MKAWWRRSTCIGSSKSEQDEFSILNANLTADVEKRAREFLELEPLFTDFEIETADGSIIQANRVVLMNRSPVFAAMLHQEMEEKRLGRMKLLDEDPISVKSFISFLYKGKICMQEMEQNCKSLLKLANKYGVQLMKSACEGFLSCKINDDNVLELLELANAANADCLKEFALQYFAVQLKRIMEKPHFNELKETDPNFVINIFHQILTRPDITIGIPYDVGKIKCFGSQLFKHVILD